MKAKVYGVDGKESGELALPPVFSTDYREEIIRRAVLAEESKLFQPKGSYRWAGLETSARYIGRKEAYATLKNRGQSRLPREFFGGGVPGRVRYIPSAVSGRRAHPPKPTKKLAEKINKKEHDLALRSAIGATANKELVIARGHKIDGDVPIIIEGNISKTKELYSLFSKLFPADLERASIKRGRNKKHPKTALVVAGKEELSIVKAASNIAGADATTTALLKVKDLAPGTHAGRLTVFTKKAIEELSKRWNE
ncbi:MAG: 50S ribosomal protein L4 [Methanobacteriota archaeon]|nr:MAG: 50S ribosomal protein L4 [Euryarchaeota archaeon]